MKKAELLRGKKIKIVSLSKICFFLLILILTSLTGSCGLEDYPYLYKPTASGNTPTYDSDDYMKDYFAFMTNDKQNSDVSVKFYGTEVYYKIYNNLYKMQSNQSAINTLNSNYNYTAAATTLIETQGYKTLKLSETTRNPLIPRNKENNNNQYVYIRLVDYQNSEDYRASICIGKEMMDHFFEEYALTGENGEIITPRRNVSEGKNTFKFGGSGEYDRIPIKGDDDTEFSDTATEDGKWYVDLYAISYGLETSTFVNYYSEALHLGSIHISESDNAY